MPTKYREEKSAVIADICRMAIKIFTNVNGSPAINIRALPHLHPYKTAWSKRNTLHEENIQGNLI